MKRKIIKERQPSDKALLYWRKFFRHTRKMAVREDFMEKAYKAAAEVGLALVIQDYQITIIKIQEEEECSPSSHGLPL